ncbi:hypothetical protein BC828DRAFT_36142 [Blastocladiella britannica]|nr:hypothetical protein BC828DRAFT_36142 [Blastocladiella britannica]
MSGTGGAVLPKSTPSLSTLSSTDSFSSQHRGRDPSDSSRNGHTSSEPGSRAGSASGAGKYASQDDEAAALASTLLDAIDAGDRDAVPKLLGSASSAAADQVLATFTVPNTDKKYSHEPEIMADVEELLGASTARLNLIQIACFLGEEDIALDILNYLATEAEEIGSKYALVTFLTSMWGNGNTTLHLAAFLGMGDLVGRILELHPSLAAKRNDRKYKPVDCTDDEVTRVKFLAAPSSSLRTFNVGGGSSASDLSSPLSSSGATTRARRGDSVSSTQGPMISPLRSALSASRSIDNISGVATASAAAGGNNGGNGSGSGRGTPGSSTPPHRHTTTSVSSTGTNSGQPVVSGGAILLAPGAKPKKRVQFDPVSLWFQGAEAGDIPTLALYIVNRSNGGNTTTVTGNSSDGAKSLGSESRVNLRRDSHGTSALHLTCGQGHLPATRWLVENGADVNALDDNGWAPLHMAAAEMHRDVLMYLIDLAEVDITARTDEDEDVVDVIDEEEEGGPDLVKAAKRSIADRKSLGPGRRTTPLVNSKLVESSDIADLAAIGAKKVADLRPTPSVAAAAAAVPSEPLINGNTASLVSPPLLIAISLQPQSQSQPLPQSQPRQPPFVPPPSIPALSLPLPPPAQAPVQPHPPIAESISTTPVVSAAIERTESKPAEQTQIAPVAPPEEMSPPVKAPAPVATAAIEVVAAVCAASAAMAESSPNQRAVESDTGTATTAAVGSTSSASTTTTTSTAATATTTTSATISSPPPSLNGSMTGLRAPSPFRLDQRSVVPPVPVPERSSSASLKNDPNAPELTTGGLARGRSPGVTSSNGSLEPSSLPAPVIATADTSSLTLAQQQPLISPRRGSDGVMFASSPTGTGRAATRLLLVREKRAIAVAAAAGIGKSPSPTTTSSPAGGSSTPTTASSSDQEELGDDRGVDESRGLSIIALMQRFGGGKPVAKSASAAGK